MAVRVRSPGKVTTGARVPGSGSFGYRDVQIQVVGSVLAFGVHTVWLLRSHSSLETTPTMVTPMPDRSGRDRSGVRESRRRIALTVNRWVRRGPSGPGCEGDRGVAAKGRIDSDSRCRRSASGEEFHRPAGPDCRLSPEVLIGGCIRVRLRTVSGNVSGCVAVGWSADHRRLRRACSRRARRRS